MRKKFPALGDAALLAHLQNAHKTSGSLCAFSSGNIVKHGPIWDSKELPDDSYAARLREMRQTLGGALTLLFEQSGLRPKDVDVVFTNSTIFAPCPSLSAMLVNEFGMRDDVTTLSTAGMGCSFGVVGVGALRDLMLGEAKSRKKKVINAVYVTGECNTAGFYLGRDPAMLTPTVLMRQGAAAVWLSTRSSFTLGGDKKRGGKGGEKAPSSPHKRKIRAKYELQHFVKVHRGADDVAYKSMGLRGDKEWLKEGKGEQGGEEEENGGENGENGDEQNDEPERIGIYFTRDVPRAASVAIDKVLRKIAPKLLSPRQLLREGLRIRREKKERKRLEKKARTSSSPSPSPASPKNRFSFADCCEHFALHPGIFSMLVAFMKGMRLPVSKALPSFASLANYANMSAASTWYVMAYLESVGDEGAFPGIRKGERVLQLGVGSGLKAGICVWKALRDIGGVDHAAWRHLDGKRVQEEDLPLPVPDVLAAEEENKNENKNSSSSNAAAGGASDAELLAAATAVVAKATGSTTRADDEATAELRRRRRPPPEVRPSAMARAEEQGREWEAAQQQRKEREMEEERRRKEQRQQKQQQQQQQPEALLYEKVAAAAALPAVAAVAAPTTPEE